MRNQNGAALIVVLSLLSVSLMVGLSSMQSSHVDERLAGNHKAASQAQMAAERAASEALVAGPSAGEFIETSLPDVAEVTFAEFSDDARFEGEESQVGTCGAGVYCRYRYVSKDDGYYVVSFGYFPGDGGGQSVVSHPVVVRLQLPSGYGGISAALSVFGGVTDINDNGNNWYPTAEKAKIQGGVFGDDQSKLYSLYYEGDEEFLIEDKNSIKNKDVFPDGLKYSSSEDVMRSSMEWLGELYAKASEHAAAVTSVDEMTFVKKNSLCSSYQFAVVDSFDVSGNRKFCGVLVHLGESLSLGGTAIVEGLVLAANPETSMTGGGGKEFDFTQPSRKVDFHVNGGGGAGSVFFNETVVDEAFKLIGENYLDYFDLERDDGNDELSIVSWEG